MIVLLTIMMVFAAYTVPRQWSIARQRERERQTIFAMQQYAKAIDEFRVKNNNALPISIQQLKDARRPRVIRGPKGELLDPLTGEFDWLVLPAASATLLPPHVMPGQPAAGPAGVPPPPPPPPPVDPSKPDSDKGSLNGSNPNQRPGLPGVPIKDYAGGAFIGVRPNAHGKAALNFFGSDTYETWYYTVNDYTAERDIRRAAAATQYH